MSSRLEPSSLAINIVMKGVYSNGSPRKNAKVKMDSSIAYSVAKSSLFMVQISLVYSFIVIVPFVIL